MKSNKERQLLEEIKRIQVERLTKEAKEMDTRQLMSLKKQSYVYEQGFKVEYDLVEGQSELLYNRYLIVNELNTREHIPNKEEAKELRRQKAKANRGSRRKS